MQHWGQQLPWKPHNASRERGKVSHFGFVNLLFLFIYIGVPVSVAAESDVVRNMQFCSM